METLAAQEDAPSPPSPPKSNEGELSQEALEQDDGEAPIVTAPAAASEQAGSSDAATSKVRKTTIRRPKPIIDLDDHIRKARDAIKLARKQVQQARVQAKLEKRKKQRLLRKASTLNLEDLERIAVLKRCGLVVSSGGSNALSSQAATEAAASAEVSATATQVTPRP